MERIGVRVGVRESSFKIEKAGYEDVGGGGGGRAESLIFKTCLPSSMLSSPR